MAPRSNKKSTTFVLVLGLVLFLVGFRTAFSQSVSFSAAPTVTAQNRTISVAVMNNAGRRDLAVANRFSNTVSVLPGVGNGTFGTPAHFDVGAEPVAVAVADFNNDGRPDLAVANFDSNNVSILLQNADGSFGPAANVAVGNGPVALAAGDLNGDGRPDLAVANFNSHNVSILLQNPDGSFGPATNITTGTNPESVIIRDFNGNGILDLAVANGNSDDVAILLGAGGGNFVAQPNIPVGAGPVWLAAGDFNGDNVQDLAVSSQFSSTVSILLGNGNGTFSVSLTIDVPDRSFSLAAADFNQNGRLDLAVTKFDADRVSILRGNGNGTFAAPVDFSVGDGPHTVAVGDFNNDGKPDLATANVLSNTISILLNTSSASTGEERLTNISTRGSVLTTDNVMIGGFIIEGTAPKKVLIRGRGPSMGGAPFNVPGVLANPFVQVFSGQTLIAQNDNWQDTPTCFGFECEGTPQIIATGLDPCQPNPGQTAAPGGCAQESAILITLPPGAYTAILSGVGGGTGVGLVEVFELDGDNGPTRLANISTRGRVATGDNVMIGGFIIEGTAPKSVLIRGRGPSMGAAPFNVPGTLANPFLQLFSGQTLIAQNDNWQEAPTCFGFECDGAPEIVATGLDPCQPNPGETTAPPGCAQESAILIMLPPGAYTAIMSGVGGGIGVGLVEVFEIN